MPSGQSDVLVVGAGLAGLAAAVALSGAGAKVSLFERKPYIGGRAYSYLHPALEEVIDSQHVLLGCCTNLLDLCRQAACDRHIRWYDEIPFLEPATAEREPRTSNIGPTPGLPAPLHNALSFLRAPMLSMRDKLRIGLGLREFLGGYGHASDDEPFSAWLQRTGQTEQSIRHLWEPVIVATLNDSMDRCSTRYAAQVLYESLLKTRAGGRMGIPTQPLSEFYAAVAQLAEEQGTSLHLRGSVERIAQEDGGWTLETSGGERQHAGKLLLALPFEQTVKLLHTLPEGHAARAAMLPLAEHFQHAPITTVHLWFDREVTALDQAALLDTRIQWMFNKARIRRDEAQPRRQQGHYLELTISASFPELAQSREHVVASSLEELSRFFPSVREARLLKSGVLKEARATFSVTPGLERFRPASDCGDGLFLAGDWTRTGWPSTMEGAVRSGRLAAGAIISAAGGLRADFLTPDLLSSGLSRSF